MNVLILGPQGCGKGTQAALLAKDLNLHHLDMGQVLRSVAKSDNEYANIVAETINDGNLVPDEYVRLIAWDFVSKHNDDHDGFIFEGYPRGVAQYEQLQEMLKSFGKKLDWVFRLDISEAETIRRLALRRTCEKCGTVYTIGIEPFICEKCGGRLILREDDKPEAILRRLQIYKQQTEPVFERAEAEGIAVKINGERPIETVHQELLAKIRNGKN